MDPYAIRTIPHNVILKRIVWLRNTTHQLVALTRRDITIRDQDLAVVRDTLKKYQIIKDKKEKFLKTNYEFYQDSALNMFLLAGERFLNLHTDKQQQSPPPPRIDDIISFNDAIWTNYWYRYDDNDDKSLDRLKELYHRGCSLGSYIVVDPFGDEINYNPYSCKCCILDSAYTAIGRFENLCNPNEINYPATFTKCVNVDDVTGLCSHICCEETACGQRYEMAILNAHRCNSKKDFLNF